MLGQLPLPEMPAKVPVPGETILLLHMLNSLPVTLNNGHARIQFCLKL